MKAREKILENLEAKGLLEKKEKYEYTIPFGDRSGEILEPFLTDQWFVDAKKLSKEAIKVVKEKKISFLPKTWEKTYFDWLENIQPWCISRQIWWGSSPRPRCFRYMVFLISMAFLDFRLARTN